MKKMGEVEQKREEQKKRRIESRGGVAPCLIETDDWR
jgi:hypothetical protein